MSSYRFNRPPWTTGVLIGFTFTCGIVSAVLIWRGGQRTRRTKEVEERLRMALAMERSPLDGKKVLQIGVASSSGPSSSQGRPTEATQPAKEKGGEKK